MAILNQRAFNNRTVLVTGGTGLLGSHLIRALTDQNFRVKAIYRSTVPSIANTENVEWTEANILDVTALEEAMQDVQQVYHCAAIVSYDPKKKRELFKTNIEGTANVVNACLNTGVEKLLFVSSVAAIGRSKDCGPVNETMNWDEKTSNSNYGKSKHLAEMEVWRGIGEGLQAVIVNPSVILGAGDWNKGSGEIFKSVHDEFPWYTDGINGFVDVGDVVKAMLLLMNSDIVAQRFIVSAENISYKDLFAQIAMGFNKRPPQKRVTPFIASVVWRLEAIKGMINGRSPMLTKETARTALCEVHYDNSKLLEHLPGFNYRPLKDSIMDICEELKKRYV